MHPEIVPLPRGGRKPFVASLVVAFAACGDNTRIDDPGLVAITGDSPIAGMCSGTTSKGKLRGGLEVEPWVAVDPSDDAHVVAGWQQDRWSDGGAQAIGIASSRDGGRSWSRSLPRFSTCAGGDFERASDPWIAIGPDGLADAVAIAFDVTTSRSAVLAASSPDGTSWSDPVTLQIDDDPDVFNDKDAITADPRMPGRYYAVWDRLTGLTQPDQPIGTGPTLLARATGGAWEPARTIFDPGIDAQTVGNVIAILPDGTLVDVFERILGTSKQHPIVDLATIRSSDSGDTWSAPTSVAMVHTAGATDPATQIGIRTGAGLPQIAVDPASGALYVAAELEASVAGPDGIFVFRSDDGGHTFTAVSQANGATEAAAFTTSIAVAADGSVGVFYYDLRDPAGATAWLATSSDHGATWSDEALSRPFALDPSIIVSYYFLGDYEGLIARGDRFVPVFARAFADNDPTDIVVRP
jgi:hypothetical protein